MYVDVILQRNLLIYEAEDGDACVCEAVDEVPGGGEVRYGVQRNLKKSGINLWVVERSVVFIRTQGKDFFTKELGSLCGSCAQEAGLDQM